MLLSELLRDVEYTGKIEDVEYYANLSEIPSLVYDGTSVDLGSVCGKPFTVATLIVNDPGDSTILDDLR